MTNREILDRALQIETDATDSLYRHALHCTLCALTDDGDAGVSPACPAGQLANTVWCLASDLLRDAFAAEHPAEPVVGKEVN